MKYPITLILTKMENEKRNEPEKYNVLYCKGKYQYKSKYPQIETKHKVSIQGQ